MAVNLLVFDGGNQNTLAIVRHLGSYNKDLKIHVIAYNKISLATFSKYVFKRHILPSLKKSLKEFKTELLKIIRDEKIDLLMPVGSNSFSFCNNEIEVQQSAKIILPPKESFIIAESKNLTQELAIKLNIPVPKSFIVKDIKDLNKQPFAFPVVIKAPFEMGKNVVEYAKNQHELEEKFSIMCKQYNFAYPDFPILQEYINGDGYGYFAYYQNGVNKCSFMHRRLREFPVTGGASTCAESIENEELKKLSETLLKPLNWNGPVMVEFKKDNNTNELKLMEINPKFWGSLELAVVSGVNFPQMVLNDLTNTPQQFPNTFKKVKFQWLINGELLHLCYRPKNTFKIIIDLFRSKNDIWLRDIVPNLIQFLLIPLRLKKK